MKKYFKSLSFTLILTFFTPSFFLYAQEDRSSLPLTEQKKVPLKKKADSSKNKKRNSPSLNKSEESKIAVDLPEIPIKENTFLADSPILIENLEINAERENPARRGEIIFFSSLSYLWVYQFLVFDLIVGNLYQASTETGQLSGINFIFSIATTILLALMVTRKDALTMGVEIYHENPYSFSGEPTPYKASIYSLNFSLKLFDLSF
jgi:hypothetical protein